MRLLDRTPHLVVAEPELALEEVDLLLVRDVTEVITELADVVAVGPVLRHLFQRRDGVLVERLKEQVSDLVVAQRVRGVLLMDLKRLESRDRGVVGVIPLLLQRLRLLDAERRL